MICRTQQLKETDWQRGRDIRLRSLVEMPDAFGATLEAEETFADEKWIQRIARPNSATFVAVTGDRQDVGLVTMAPYDKQIGLFGMWVDPQFRGKGVGGMLVDSGILWSKARGFDRIYLDVGDHNHAAIALYQSRGFMPTGQTSTLPSPREHILEHQRLLEIASQREQIGAGNPQPAS